jgi:hypothetical protein
MMNENWNVLRAFLNIHLNFFSENVIAYVRHHFIL